MVVVVQAADIAVCEAVVLTCDIGWPGACQGWVSLVATAYTHCRFRHYYIAAQIGDGVSSSYGPSAVVARYSILVDYRKRVAIAVKCLNSIITLQAADIAVIEAVVLTCDIGWPGACQCWGCLVATAYAHCFGNTVIACVGDGVGSSYGPSAVVARNRIT